MIGSHEILFCGLGTSAVLWYRVALPALHLGADWVGIQGTPPQAMVLTGLVRGQTMLPTFADYRVVILQQPSGRGWLRQINSLRAQGIKVLYEIDDYLHGVRKQAHHDFAKHYSKAALAEHEMCMRVCDGLIVSTEYIGRRYKKFNPNVYLCPNGVDLDRYRLTKPERPTVNIGWAGATGHTAAILDWMPAVIDTMSAREDTAFVAIGQPGLARAVGQGFGERRAIGVPFAPLECYPAAMTLMDIALAPAGKSGWYRGKSDLRWLEASALGIPTIADPAVYPEIEDGVTGFHASSPEQDRARLAELVAEPELRVRVGAAARAHVETRRSSEDAALRWLEVCTAVAGEYESVAKL